LELSFLPPVALFKGRQSRKVSFYLRAKKYINIIVLLAMVLKEMERGLMQKIWILDLQIIPTLD
jgi:hypothetical protein